MKGQTRKVTDKNDDNDTASQRTDGTQKGDTQCTARSEYKTQSTQNNPMTWHRDSHVMTLCDWHVMASRLLWCHDIGAWQNNYFPLPHIPEFFPYPDVPDLEVSANPLSLTPPVLPVISGSFLSSLYLSLPIVFLSWSGKLGIEVFVFRAQNVSRHSYCRWLYW